MKIFDKRTRIIFNYRESVVSVIVLLSSIFFSVDSIGQENDFVEMDFNLPSILYSNAAWADSDNDDDLDLFLIGLTGSGEKKSYIYNNMGSDSFSLVEGNPLFGVHKGSIVPGDYDNDGYLDILLSGNKTAMVYRNLCNNVFGEQTGIELIDVGHSAAALGDCNNDGYLDILISGRSLNLELVSKIYLNNRNNTFTELKDINLLGTWDGSVAWGDYDNDGNLDILITGGSYEEGESSKIYRNNGDSTFIEQTDILLPGISEGVAIWGDYDNDGYLDILLTGEGLSKIYRNNGGNSFTEQTGIKLQGLSDASADWGDYNNDGFLDIIMAGRSESNEPTTIIYYNNGDNTFTKHNDTIVGISGGAVKWGDYNNDGNLDFVITGSTIDGEEVTKIYKNIGNTESQNTPPNEVTTAGSEVIENTVTLKWLPATDDHTPSKGLSYNVKVGTTPGGNDIVSSNSAANGYFRLAQMGNAQLNTFFILKSLPKGTYYWSVQAIDNSYKTGAFSQVDSFTIDTTITNVSYPQKPEIKIFPNPARDLIQVTGLESSTEIQYKLINYMGQLIQQGFLRGSNIQLDLNDGFYILTLFRDNKMIHKERIIVKQ